MARWHGYGYTHLIAALAVSAQLPWGCNTTRQDTGETNSSANSFLTAQGDDGPASGLGLDAAVPTGSGELNGTDLDAAATPSKPGEASGNSDGGNDVYVVGTTVSDSSKPASTGACSEKPNTRGRCPAFAPHYFVCDGSVNPSTGCIPSGEQRWVNTGVSRCCP